MQSGRAASLVCAAMVLLCCVLSFAAWRGVYPVMGDSVNYMIGGISALSGKGYLDQSGDPQLHFPPVYPLAVGLLNKLSIPPVEAGRLVSLLASALTAIPLFFIARRVFGDKTAWVATATYAVLPERIVLSNMVLSEPLYVALMIAGVWLWMQESDQHSKLRAACVGLLFGLSVLVRQEGLLVAGLLFFVSILRPRWFAAPHRGSAIVSVVVMVLVMLPYAAFMHSHTGRWSISRKGIVTYNCGVGIARNLSFNEFHKLDPAGKQEIIISIHETPKEMLIRSLKGLRQEMRDLTSIIGPVLMVCLALGIWFELYRANKPLIEALPVFVALSLQLVYLPILLVDLRYVYAGALGVLIIAAHQLVSRFELPWKPAARWRLVVVVPIVLSLAVFAPDLRNLFLRRLPPRQAPIMGSWLQSQVPPGERVLVKGTPTTTEMIFAAGSRFVYLPWEPIDRVIDYAHYRNIRYVVLLSTDELHPDLSDALREDRDSFGIELVSTWYGSDGGSAELLRLPDRSERPRVR